MWLIPVTHGSFLAANVDWRTSGGSPLWLRLVRHGWSWSNFSRKKPSWVTGWGTWGCSKDYKMLQMGITMVITSISWDITPTMAYNYSKYHRYNHFSVVSPPVSHILGQRRVSSEPCPNHNHSGAVFVAAATIFIAATEVKPTASLTDSVSFRNPSVTTVTTASHGGPIFFLEVI